MSNETEFSASGQCLYPPSIAADNNLELPRGPIVNLSPEAEEQVRKMLTTPPQLDPKLGRKLDGGKPDWSLLDLNNLTDTVSVLTFGAKKYARDNWKYVDDAQNRYHAALIRHLAAYQSGEYTDPESGLPHLAHAMCCLIFLSWFAKQEHEKTESN